MDLSELIDELREIALYDTNPQDWMGHLDDVSARLKTVHKAPLTPLDAL